MPSSHAAWEHSARLAAGYEMFHRQSPVTDLSGSYGQAELSLQWLRNSWRGVFKSYSLGRSGVKDKSKSSHHELQEFFFEYAGSAITAQLGFNSVHWGVTDFNNPLDLVSTRNYDSLLSSIKRGAPMLRLEKAWGRWILEGLWIPKNVPSLIPSETSRFLPRESLSGRFVGSIPSELGLIKGYLSDQPIEYRQKPSSIINGADKNNVGLRIQGGFAETDFQAVYYEGLPQSPEIEVEDFYMGTKSPIQVLPEVLYVIGPNLLLTPSHSKWRTVGFGASSTFGSWLVKVATARSKNLRTESKLRASQSFVSSVERPFSFWGLESTWIIQNYQIYEEQDLSSSLFDSSGFFSLTKALNQSWLLGARFAAGLDWSFNLGTQLSTESKGLIGRVNLDYRLSDSLQLFLGTELIDGETGSTLHQLRSASRSYLGLSLSM